MNQSFKQVFVTNSGALLSSGTTADLAVGQIGIFDGSTYQATVAPTFFKNKSLVVGWGYPDLVTPLMAGIFNENEKSKEIKGRKIKRVRTKKAKHGRPEIVTVGWSGDVADDSTITVPADETKAFYLRLTGAPIDRLYGTNGLIRRYVVQGPCSDDCADDCVSSVDNRLIAENLAMQINSDPKVQGLVKASTQFTCSEDVSVTTQNCYVFSVTLCDDGTDTALGYVQSQVTGAKVSRTDRSGAMSTYSVTLDANVAPAAVSNAGLTIIPDCPVCPSGYTLVASGYIYEVKRADDGDATALTAVETDYGISGSETGVRLSYQGGVSTYILNSSTTLTVQGTDQFKFVGQSRNSCVITSPSTTAWALSATLVKYPKVFRITIADDICGNNRLADLQAAFPTLTVSVVDTDGSCVHTYETTVYSQCVEPGCSLDTLVFTAPQGFEGAVWEEVPSDVLADGVTCLAGITLESAWVDRVTNECTYGFWSYNKEGVHIEISEFDANYNGEPELCKIPDTKVRTIQSLQYSQGEGQFVRELEERSKEYFLKSRSFDPIVREIEGFEFIAKPENLYDQISIEFDFDYPVGMFSERYNDAYTLDIFVKEGLGASIVAALNSYITSPEIGLDAITL